MRDRRTILIIDDETDLCLLLKDYFVRKHYEVIVTHTLEEGTNTLYSRRPDILFLDNNLPDGVGWTSAAKFATDMPDMYIVLISAFHPAKPEMPQHAKYSTIEKPVSLAELDTKFASL